MARLATALPAQQPGEAAVADILCQRLRRTLTGGRPYDRHFRAAGRPGDLRGGFEALSGVRESERLTRSEGR